MAPFDRMLRILLMSAPAGLYNAKEALINYIFLDRVQDKPWFESGTGSSANGVSMHCTSEFP